MISSVTGITSFVSSYHIGTALMYQTTVLKFRNVSLILYVALQLYFVSQFILRS